MGEAKPSRASEAASLRRSLSAIFGFRGRCLQESSGKAWRPIRASPQRRRSGWRPTETASSPRRSTKPSATAGEPGPSSSVRPAKRELERWGGGWAPRRAQRRPGRIRYRPPPKEARAGSGDGAARRHSVAARGGFAGATASALLPNDGLQLPNGPSGLARGARLAVEPSVRRSTHRDR